MRRLVKYVADKENDERPLICTVPLDYPHAKYSSSVLFRNPVGKTFFYEKTDPFPVQLYLAEKIEVRDAAMFDGEKTQSEMTNMQQKCC